MRMRIVVCLALLLLVEGLASAVVVGHTAWQLLRPLEDRVHTQYDAELGWVGIPNLAIRDLYGQGASLSINAQGFRASQAFPDRRPGGRVRIICSGDSFTFGVGVGDEDVWCHQFAAIDPRIEPINMGQIGYGTDQAYLWYRRDAVKIEHDIQILAFVAADFDRMRYAEFMSYGKPVLAVERETLVVRNVPVPHRSTAAVKLRRLAWAITTLRTAQVVRSLLPARAIAPADDQKVQFTDSHLRPVVARLVESLIDLHARQGTILVLVFLPERSDYIDRASDGWRQFIRQVSRDRIPVVDLVDDFRALPAAEVDAYFIRPGESRHGLAEGHYSARGHRYIAQTIYRGLASVEAVKSRLDGAVSGR